MIIEDIYQFLGQSIITILILVAILLVVAIILGLVVEENNDFSKANNLFK